MYRVSRIALRVSCSTCNITFQAEYRKNVRFAVVPIVVTCLPFIAILDLSSRILALSDAILGCRVDETKSMQSAKLDDRSILKE